MERFRGVLVSAGLCSILLIAGCGKRGSEAKDAEVTAVVSMTKEELKRKLPDTAHPRNRGEKPGSLKGAVLLIDPLGKLLRVDTIKLINKGGKSFLVVQCSDGIIELEVLPGEVAINGQPGFVVGELTER